MTTHTLTGKQLRIIVLAASFLFPPLIFLVLALPLATWNKWAQRYL